MGKLTYFLRIIERNVQIVNIHSSALSISEEFAMSTSEEFAMSTSEEFVLEHEQRVRP